MSERDPLARVLPRVERPGRYVGGEWNEIRKDPARVRISVALAFPDVYEIGMSYLGQKILYDLLNARPEIRAERVFPPWPDPDEAPLGVAGGPAVFNPEPVAEFFDAFVAGDGEEAFPEILDLWAGLKSR